MKPSKGSKLTSLTKLPITREQLALYAEASLDHNPIHLDENAAKSAGLPGVIAHGMITMAFFGEMLHQNLIEIGSGRISELSCRFRAMTFPGDTITVNGSVRDVREDGIHCDLEARNQKGELTATGQALLNVI